ncbi:MAG: MoaD/ThiS family protein [Micrococcales bacterium]|nr:MoaD/ThiS family protein [Micrococcales bacterium]
MSNSQLPGTVTVRYWAAAAAAAGTAQESLPVGSVAQILDAARRRHPDLERVLAVATILHDGRVLRPGQEVPVGAELEVLPPFAGG